MTKTVTKKDLSAELAVHMGWTQKKSNLFVTDIFDWIKTQMLAGFIVSLKNFGSFTMVDRKERWLLHPVTKERLFVEAQRLPLFQVAKTLLQRLNQKKGLL